MPLQPDALETHPDGEQVNKVDPEAVGYRSQSKWVDRFCGNCAWFEERSDFEDQPDITGDEHPEADQKGPVHRCALVGGGIARGGYCVAWGTRAFATASGQRSMTVVRATIDGELLADADWVRKHLGDVWGAD